MKKFTIEVSHASPAQLPTIALDLKIMSNGWEKHGPQIKINGQQVQAPSLRIEGSSDKQQASSSKSPDTRDRPQAWAPERQATSCKPQYNHIHLIGFKSVKERSKKYNRRTEQTIQDARAGLQPTSPHVHYWVNIS